MRLLIVFCALSVANGFGGGGSPAHHNHHGGPPHHQKHPHVHKLTPRQIPHFYNSLPPHIIASPRPMSPTFRTLNPSNQQPHVHSNPQAHQPHRSPRSEPKQPNMITSASTTPVLVLKKDHTRPVLSSAVLASTIAEKRQQAQHASEHKPQIPTVIMERPGNSPPPPQPQANQQPQQPPKQKQEKEEPQEERKREQEQPERPSSHETSLEQDNHSNELPPSPIPQSASAERRMFFGSISQNSASAHQVSGPQGPPTPHHHPRKPPQQQPQHRLSHSASNVQQTRAHSQPPQKPHHPVSHFGEDSLEDENLERITRSNSQNPYQGGSQFEYPPPQGNYISSGPTRVPVKYQQGVVGVRPQHQERQHQNGERGSPYQQDGRPRPYKQRIQQGQQSEEPLSEELEDEEEQKPDRLQELLATSKFTCASKKDGYYADDTLNCEVFHYCQDGGKHSWLCPNGFAFHQIHLICVPPSSDNICKQSSDFHFVNEYLYRPVNQKEADSSHNISLKYADRYFPDEYNNGAGDVLLPYHGGESEEEDRPVRNQQQQQRPHHQVAHNPYATPQQQHQSRPRPQPTQQTPPYNPYASVSPRQQSQYPSFIPSPQVPQQHRPQPQQPHRPTPHSYSQRSGPPPSPHHHAANQKQLHPKPHASHPHPNQPHSHSTQKHPTAFFSPESINIPLNQRRPIPNPHPSHHPQIFRPSPQVHASKAIAQATKESSSRRKFEDEDEYEY